MGRAAVIALALVVLAGCGGGSGQQLTKQQFASKADSICVKGNERQKELGNPANIAGVADLARVADKTLEILADAISDLSKLKPPTSEQARVNQWLAQVRLLTEDLRQIRDKAKQNDLKALQAIAATSQAHNQKANAIATELGMSVCNKG
jgi:hypothetical protein